MSDNVLYDFLGVNLDEVSALSEQQHQQAISIAKLTENPEWATFKKFLDMLQDKSQRPVEFYAQNQLMTHYDCGYRRALNDINLFVDNQIKILEKYVKEKN